MVSKSKWTWMNQRITAMTRATAEDYTVMISSTGEPVVVKVEDGRIVETEAEAAIEDVREDVATDDYLHDVLELLFSITAVLKISKDGISYTASIATYQLSAQKIMFTLYRILRAGCLPYIQGRRRRDSVQMRWKEVYNFISFPSTASGLHVRITHTNHHTIDSVSFKFK
jgi:hypothetical protein